MMKSKFFTILFSTFACLAMAQQKLPQLGKDPIDKVIKALTIEEKSLLVTGAKRREVIPVALPGRKMKTITAVGGYTYPFIHLGIPSMMVSDGPAGLRIAPKRLNDTASYYCTAFPVASLLASSWDVNLAQKIGSAMGNEAKEYGVDIILGPALNIHRDALGGRNFEYYSEDPLISGKMAASVIKGIQSQDVGACIKHFAANNQETSRRTIDVIASERALREIYLEGFRIAVKEAKPWSVMSSYNKINGVYTPQSSDLLAKVLRKEWGFKGFVMTDWYGGDNAVEQMRAGNDLLMPGLALWSGKIDTALRDGTLDSKIVDQNIKRILEAVLKTGTFQDRSYSNQPNFASNEKLARSAAAESIVLLKNKENILPLSSSKKVAAYGAYSYKNIPGGTGSGSVNNKYNVSIAQGLANAGFQLLPDLTQTYLNYLKKGKPVHLKADSLITALVKQDSILGELTFNEEQLKQQATKVDVAVVTFMRVFGEGGDRKLPEFYLTKEEKQLLSQVSSVYHLQGKKVIVVLNIGGPIETASWRDQADAILLTWLSGQEGGNAVADLVTGTVTPSGKLATTFPMDYTQTSTAKNFPGFPADKPEKVFYEEGIYLGYRFYDTFNVKPAYPFGFGLSYTKFEYSDLKLTTKQNGEIAIAVTIKNIGNVKGKEIVQLYVSAPTKQLAKPTKELKGFAKTKLLAPGETETLYFELNGRSLASFDSASSSWIAEAGNYKIQMAASSDEIKLSVNFNLPKLLVAERVEKVFPLKEKLTELKK